MKNTIAFVAALFITAAIVGAYYYPHSQFIVNGGVGAPGDTNSTSRIASCVLDMSTTTPTTATTTGTGCLFNGDSKDRYITATDYYLTGLGAANTSVASTTWKLSTSSNVYTGSAAYVLNTTLATSTANGAIGGEYFIASTTPGATATFDYRVWPAGTYLDLLQNASSTAQVTFVVRYFINN